MRECYGRVVYSHKTHEKCADLLLTKHARIKLGQILLSAVTTAGFIGAILGTGPWAAVAGGLVSIGLLTLNAYTKNYDLGELAQKHRNAANELWIVRERYLALLVDIAMREKPIESLQAQRDEITSQLHKVYSGAPSTNNPAYKKAQTALKTLEDMTFSDAEIDAFLPGELKRSSQVQAVLDAEVSKLVQPLRGASDGKL
ncbi:hypothetical protein F183_A41090 [Bryobacterales bacterium F-183]|nr:hypothetical protein F183_A41090 [Bryobacterales bacterium F-183]